MDSYSRETENLWHPVLLLTHQCMHEDMGSCLWSPGHSSLAEAIRALSQVECGRETLLAVSLQAAASELCREKPCGDMANPTILPLARSDFYLGSTQQSPTPDLQIRGLLESLKGIFGGQIMQQIFLRRKEKGNLSLLPSTHHPIVVQMWAITGCLDNRARAQALLE